jgi:hypothetical protein
VPEIFFMHLSFKIDKFFYTLHITNKKIIKKQNVQWTVLSLIFQTSLNGQKRIVAALAKPAIYIVLVY